MRAPALGSTLAPGSARRCRCLHRSPRGVESLFVRLTYNLGAGPSPATCPGAWTRRALHGCGPSRGVPKEQGLVLPLPPLSAPWVLARPGCGRPVPGLGSWSPLSSPGPAALLCLARPERSPHRTFRLPRRAGPDSSALHPSSGSPHLHSPAPPGDARLNQRTASSVFGAVSWAARIWLGVLRVRRALRSRLDRPGPSAAPRRSKAALQERPSSPVPQPCTLNKYASGELDTNADSGAPYPGGSF